MNKEKVLDRFLSNIGLFDNVFGKVTDLIVYNTEKEKIKRYLYEVYGKKDVYTLFPPELDREDFNKTLKTLFSYYDADDREQITK